MAMTGDLFDVCVVGAGVEGSSAARYLASWGKNTLLLEQFPLPHCRGSSHGQSRLVRYGYSQSFLTAVMPEAFEMWSDIEKKAGKTLIRRCGLLTIGEPPYDDLSRVITNVRGVGQECLQLTGDEINKRFPGLNLSSLECGAFEPRSGLIQADLALKALRVSWRQLFKRVDSTIRWINHYPVDDWMMQFISFCNTYPLDSDLSVGQHYPPLEQPRTTLGQEQFVEFGGALHDAEKVLDIQPGSVINIKTNKNSYRAKSVIITAGPWTNNVLRPLGIQIPLTICPHAGVSIEDADNREGPSRGFDQNYIDGVAELIKARFPGVKPEPSITESCIYSVTPDHLFVLDRHPKYKNIVIGAGFSGHGFKMAPVVGRILTQMVLGEKVSYDVIPFRLSRFTSPKSSL